MSEQRLDPTRSGDRAPAGRSVNDPRDAWLAAAFRSRGEDARPREDCPAPERIWQAVRLELPVDERVKVVDHLADCPACAEAWSLAVELTGELETDARPPSFVGVLTRHAWPLAAAAALALAIGIVYVVPSLRPGVDPTVRDSIGAVLEPRTPERGSYQRESFWLRWSGGPAGSRYDIVVTTADLKVVAEARGLDATEYRVPPERLAQLPAGTSLLWRVVAHTPEGTTVASRTFEVYVR